MKSNTSQMFLLLVLSLGMCAVTTLPAAPPAAPVADSQKQALASVFGADVKDWELVSATDAAISKTVDGQIGLAPAGQAAIALHSHINYGPGTEHILKLRFLSGKANAGTIDIALGREDLKNTEEKGLSASLGVADDAGIWCVFHNQFIERSGNAYIRTTYSLRGLNTEQANWPDDYRARVKQLYSGLPGVTDKWITVRIVSLKDRVRAFVDNRLFGEWPADEQAVRGKMSITLRGEVLLSSVCTTALAEDSLYVPVALDDYANASEFNGSTVKRNSLGAAIQVGGVPFVFVEPDARGNDHIDIGQSWCKYGTLVGGYLTANGGVFGGRWRSALTVNPSRIQFALPKEAYSKLHVLAIADDEPDCVPQFTAQFYVPSSGVPVNAAATAPLFSAKAADATRLPIELADGRRGALYLVTIELDADRIDRLCQLEVMSGPTRYSNGRTMLGLELTKEIQLFRTYPDPISYSTHGAGLPSAVHIYAMTLERPRIQVALQGDKLAQIWTSPETPHYDVQLTNRSNAARTVSLKLETASYDGVETTRLDKEITVKPGATLAMPFSLNLTRYGTHDVKLTLADGDQTWTANRRLAHLHKDTRTRGDWKRGRGALFGYWGYGAGHYGPPTEQELLIMAKAGCETVAMANFRESSGPLWAIGKKYGMKTFPAFEGHDKWDLSGFASRLRAGEDPAEAEAWLLEALKRLKLPANELDESVHLGFFAEPQIGPITHGNLPSYWGEPEHVLTKSEKQQLDLLLDAFLRGRKIALQEWPEVKMMFPWGDPLFVPPFLRHDKKLAELIDAQGIDEPFFERLPEMQIGQAAGHRKWQLRQEWKKVGKEPEYIFVEGNFVPAIPGAVTEAEQADYIVRNHLHFLAYNMYNLPAGVTGVTCADYYGEEHYGGGYPVGPLPHMSPRPGYSAYATLTRHLNRKNFVKYVPTGSETVFCVQFKHYNSDELTHVLWTVRGTRPATLTIPAGSDLAVYDQMDNRVAVAVNHGQAALTVSSSPQFIEGLSRAPAIALGQPDHSDAAPGKYARKLTNFGAGGWTLKAARDKTYENNHPHQIARFLGDMSAKAVDAPAAQGSKALAIHLKKQNKERIIMPWYTTLVPDKPIVIPGKTSHLGVWVKANSDWGRVIYSLRDAQGERWVSIGMAEQWNCDDIHGASAFNFDGWRYLRFEMPANAPYDSYRENGSTWWGHLERGDGIVDLPLTLEKVIVERRTHVMYVNEPVPANPADVLLGDLIAEYAKAADQGDEAVRLSRLRMPLPAAAGELDNPIARMAAQGVGAPTRVTGYDLPMHGPDGTKCHIKFELVEDAGSYDIWAGPHGDGRGAKLLAGKVRDSGPLVRGFHPDTDFYVFVVYTDQNGKASKPSAPFKIRLKDLFLQK